MTPSFAAYRKYAMAQRIDVSDKAAARRLLHEAVELDPAFAWAWWSLGIKAAEFRDSSVMFIEEALRHPERLTESERYQIEAGLVWIRDEDYPRTVSLIDRALLIDPSTPIGNKCGALANMGRRQEAAECMDLDEARSPFGRTAIGIRNDVNLLIEVGRIADAERVAAQLQAPRRWQQYFALKIALASANWVRAESLATAYLADPTSEPWVPGRSQLALASVYAARGAIGRADSMLSRTQGAHPFGVAVARSFLVTVTGHRVAPWLTEINDTLPGQLFWRVARNLAGGDTSEARSALDALRGLSPDSHPRAARYARERARFAEALVAAHRGRWDDVIAAARAQLESWVGAELHLFSRWLLAAAYDRQGMKDSAVAYYTKATESSGIDSYELFYVGEPYSFSHFRLGQLLTEMGDADRAKAHWATFLDTFTDPDPEYAWMVMEARTKLEELARGR
jgi:tetratricopeptide (TPR) repeat protein